jgi:glyoxylase I family protein
VPRPSSGTDGRAAPKIDFHRSSFTIQTRFCFHQEKNVAGKNSVLGGGGFHHVAVKVFNPHFDKAVAFYKALGCVERTAWGEAEKRGILLDTGDGNYMELFANGPDLKHDEWGVGAAVAHLALRTTNCDAAIRIAEKAGAKVTAEPKNVEMGPEKIKIRIAFCQAPGGEVVEFFQNEPGVL